MRSVTLGLGAIRVGTTLGPRALTVARSSRLDGCVILLVEDHDHTRDMLAECFETQGATVLAVADACSARAAVAQAKRVDLIVTDIAMPRESGVRMMMRMRAAGHLVKVPAIAISGQIRAEELVELEPALFQAVLTKPFDPFRLLAIARDLVS